MPVDSITQPASARRNAFELEDLIRSQPYPTMGIAMAAKDPSGETLFCHGHVCADGGAPVVPDTQFLFGSFTKVLTAAIVCQLVDEKRIRLDDAVVTYLPQVPYDDVTVRHLLSHTAGLPDMFHRVDSADEVIAHIANVGRLAPAGAGFSYSNAGYVILGHLIEEICGNSWLAELARRWLEPLHIASVTPGSDSGSNPGHGHVYCPETGGLVSGAMWPEVGSAFEAAGSRLQGTARDAARLAMAILTGRGPDHRRALLSPGMVAEMLTPQVVVPGAGLMASQWCLGWSVLSERGARIPVYGHQGGTSVLVAALPAQAATCAVLSNFPFGYRLARDLIREHLGVSLHTSVTRASAAPPADDFARLAGTYRSSTLSITVRCEHGRLLISNPLGGPAVPLVHLNGRSFCADYGELVTDVTFSPAEDEPPASVHIALRLLPRVT